MLLMHPMKLLAQGIIYERRLFRSAFSLDDQKEGMQAFIEKEKLNLKINILSQELTS